jgi:UDP-glucose-4-epimerase GalE
VRRCQIRQTDPVTILVTGGAGYIGSHTVRLLQEQGRDVVAFDSMEFGHAAAVGDVPLVRGDVGDPGAVTEAVQSYGIDAVIHFAAYKSVGESMSKPQLYFGNNVAKSAALLESLHAAGVTRVVFSSTAAVYGTPETVPVREDAPIQPESPYGESKAITERVLHWYDCCLDLRSVSLRYFNAAGAWPDGSIGEDWTVTTNLVPLLMKAVLGASGPLQVFGTDYPTPDGTAIRDYVHVLDLAEAHIKALEYLESGGDSTVLNLGTGVGSSVLEVLTRAERVIGRPIPHELVGRRHGDPVALFADTTLAKAALGWSADSSLDDILGSAWAWHSAHAQGYGD